MVRRDFSRAGPETFAMVDGRWVAAVNGQDEARAARGAWLDGSSTRRASAVARTSADAASPVFANEMKNDVDDDYVQQVPTESYRVILRAPVRLDYVLRTITDIVRPRKSALRLSTRRRNLSCWGARWLVVSVWVDV